MWRWLSRTCASAFWVLAISSSSPCWATPTSSGPTSDEEAQLLWQDGQTAFKNANYEDTVQLLARYVDRYVGYPGFLEAHSILGESYFRLKQPQKAVPPLRNYVQAKGLTPDSAQARVWLGRSYLSLNQFEEALQVSLELNSLPSPPPDVVLWKLIIKSRALLGLHLKNEKSAAKHREQHSNHLNRAETTLVSAENAMVPSTPNEIKGQIFVLKLRAKLISCDQLHSTDPLDEAQASSLMDRRGTCLQEALVILQKVLKAEESETASEAAQLFQKSYQRYYEAANHPPPPPPSLLSNEANGADPADPANRARTPEELQSYRAELIDLLLKNLKATTHKCLELIKAWKPSSQSPSSAAFQQLSKYLEHTHSRIK